MRYMALVQVCQKMESNTPPSPEFMKNMKTMLDEMTKAGELLSCEVLTATSQGTRLRYAGGKTTSTDGPFAETKELIGGFLILQAQSKEEAIGLAQRLIDLHVASGFEEIGMEIRQIPDSFF